MADVLSAPELLHAVLAMQLGLVSLEEAQWAIDACTAGGGKRIREALVEAQRLSQAQDELIAKLVEAYLSIHDGDAARGLAQLERTPGIREALDKLDSRYHEATLSFDGSKTAGRKLQPRQDDGVHVTAAGERFRKLKLHAAGGLGEVSLARDEQLHREVALKQIQEKFADDAAKRQRFILEGEVTGALEHPGIVPVYAMGVDAQGRPFYAMRFIRGESLRHAALAWHKSEPATRRHRRDSLQFRRLLQRFVSVCHAIEYAHSRGVVHRDIKPANVMLGKYGETYVVDWGLARVIGRPSSDPGFDSEELLQTEHLSGSLETQFGSVVGTPAYMSPEQAAGRHDEVGPASDVYSLGATLYFLLTGQAPFTSADGPALNLMLRIELGLFPPPRQVNPCVSRELDAICLRAMAIRPGDRYSTALALAADVEQWLADEPVAACPPTLLDRLTRWSRKHRNWVVAGAATAGIVAVVATLAAIAVNRARQAEHRLAVQNLRLAKSEAQARQQAERRFLQARQTVDTWLTGYSEALRHFPGMQPVRARMLELAAREYERFVQEKHDDPTLQLERARTLVRLGSIYRLLGRHDESLVALDQARQSLEPLSSQAGTDRDAQISLALACGMIALAHADRGDAAKADAAFVEGLERLETLVAATTEDVDALAALVTLWTNRAGVLAAAGEFQRADDAYRSALAHGERLTSAAPSELRHRAAVAAASLGTGQVLLAQGDAAAASRRFQQAVSFFGAATQIENQDPGHLELLIAAHLHLASARRRLGDLSGEQAAYEAAIAGARSLVDSQPDVPAYRENLALAETDLGQLLLEKFDAGQAEPILREGAELLARLVAEYPAMANYRQAHAAALDNLAQVRLALGRYEEALSAAELAATELRRLVEAWPAVAPYRERLAVAESTAAHVLIAMGNPTESERRFAAAEERLTELLAEDAGPDRRQAAAILFTRYGVEAWRQSRQAEAAELFKRAGEQWNAVLSASDDPQFACSAAWHMLISPDPEQRNIERALNLAESAFRAAPDNVRYRLTYALALALDGKTNDCLSILRADEAQKENAVEAFGFVVAMAEQAEGRVAEARAAWQSAADWTETHLPGHWDLDALRLLAAHRLGISPAETTAPTRED